MRQTNERSRAHMEQLQDQLHMYTFTDEAIFEIPPIMKCQEIYFDGTVFLQHISYSFVFLLENI